MTAPAPVTAQLTPSSDTKCVEATVEDFKITDIPDVMLKLGWKESARIMQRWFDGDGFVMSSDEKEGRLAVDKITQEKLFADLNFDWLSSESPHTGVIIDALSATLTSTSQYNEVIGRKNGFPSQLTPGLLQFMTRMRKLGILDEQNQDLTMGAHDFSGLDAIGLETTTQANFRPIGLSVTEKKDNPMDDVYGALGGFIVKIAITKFSTAPKTKISAASLRIHEVGCYIRDTYDFLNEDGKDQLLGYWNSEGVVKPSYYEYLSGPDTVEREGKKYFKVTNDSFNCYRAQLGKGGDLFVYSNVKKIPTSILIYLSAADFAEFMQKTNRPAVSPP